MAANGIKLNPVVGAWCRRMNRLMNRTDDLYIIGAAFLLRHLLFPFGSPRRKWQNALLSENGWICSHKCPILFSLSRPVRKQFCWLSTYMSCIRSSWSDWGQEFFYSEDQLLFIYMIRKILPDVCHSRSEIDSVCISGIWFVRRCTFHNKLAEVIQDSPGIDFLI